MSAALFDVNFLLALAWPHHQFHSIARSWFDKHHRLGWATCTVTQLGFIRLSSNPSYLPKSEKTPEEARQLLAALIDHPNHRFLSKVEAPVHFSEISRILGHQQLTDAYLLGVARLSKVKFVTFNKAVAALASSKNSVEVLTAKI
jgi:toxin-antitoxin system PIN domain toxin